MPVGLFDAVEQTALTRAKATLLMNAMLEIVANEQDAQKKAEPLAAEKKTKWLNDMSMMKPSELWKMAVDDRVRGLLKSESSQKGKGKGKGKGKNKTFDPQKLYSLYQDHNGPLSEDSVEQVMLQKSVHSPAGAWAKSSTSKASGKGLKKSCNGKGTGKGQKSGQEKGKTQSRTSKGKGKGKSSGKGKQVQSQPAQGKGKGKGKNKEGFTGGEPNKDWKSVR